MGQALALRDAGRQAQAIPLLERAVQLDPNFALAWLRRVHNRTRRTFAPTVEMCAELAALGFGNLGVLSRGVDLRYFTPGRRDARLRASWGHT